MHAFIFIPELFLFCSIEYALELVFAGGVRELKEPDAPAGVQSSGQAIRAWLLRLMGKGLQMSLVKFLCVLVPESSAASWLRGYTLMGAKERDANTLYLSLTASLMTTRSGCLCLLTWLEKRMMEAVLVKHLLFPVQLKKTIRLEEWVTVKSFTGEKKTKVIIIYVCQHTWPLIRN